MLRDVVVHILYLIVTVFTVAFFTVIWGEERLDLMYKYMGFFVAGIIASAIWSVLYDVFKLE